MKLDRPSCVRQGRRHSRPTSRTATSRPAPSRPRSRARQSSSGARRSRKAPGEPRALRAPVLVLLLEGADRAVGRRHRVRIPDARRGASGEFGRTEAPLAVRQVPAAGRRRRIGGRNDADHRASAGASSGPEPLDPGWRGRPAGALPRPLLRPLCDGQHARPVFDILRPEGSRDPYGGAAGARQSAHRLRLARGQSRRRAVGGGRPSRSPTAPPRRRCSTPTGSRRSARQRPSSLPIAPGCSPIRSSPARSTRAAPTGPSSRLGAPDRD